MIKFAWWSEKRIRFIRNTSGEKQEFKELLISDQMQDIALETIKKLLGKVKKEINVKASMIAQHSAEKDKEEEERLLEKETHKSRMVNE